MYKGSDEQMGRKRDMDMKKKEKDYSSCPSVSRLATQMSEC